MINRNRTKEQLAELYKLKIGQNVCMIGETGQDGQFLGPIQAMNVKNTRAGNVLRVVVAGQEYSALDVTRCPSPEEIREMSNAILDGHGMTRPDTEVDLS